MRKRFFALCMVFLTVSAILCGCVNITIVDKDDSSKETQKATTPQLSESKEKMYSSSANIIAATSSDAFNVSSDSLKPAKSLIDICRVILQHKDTQALVKAAYPNIEYTCDIEEIEKTSVFRIVVQSKEKEHLQEICDMLADEFCAIATTNFEVTFARANKATSPTLITGD